MASKLISRHRRADCGAPVGSHEWRRSLPPNGRRLSRWTRVPPSRSSEGLSKSDLDPRRVHRRVGSLLVMSALLTLFGTNPSWSQSPQGGESPTDLTPGQSSLSRAIVTIAAPIFAQPDASRVPLRIAKEGSVLLLVEQQGEWCRIQFQDPQYGLREGYIQSQFVRIAPASSPQAAPSVQPPSRSSPSSAPRAETSTAREWAQADRGWIDIDFARFVSFQDSQTFALMFPVFEETGSYSASYPQLAGANGFQIGGGIGLAHGIGIAVTLGEVNYDQQAVLAVTIPSPFFLATPGMAATLTDTTLTRRERSIDFSAVYTIPLNRVRIRVFGGGTYFHLSNQMVEKVLYTQSAGVFVPTNVVTITGFTQQEPSGFTFGFNVGADVAVFFTRTVGVGGGLRFNQGTVTLTDPLSGQDADFSVGHLVLGGGLRLRF